MERSHQKKEEVRRDAAPNRTGIPVQMKLDFENRSGLSFDDVRVHYRSEKPARLGALAYTQGTQVYLGSGQERFLPHELGHVVQQKRENVPVTHRVNGLGVNADPTLENRAGAFASGSANPFSQLSTGRSTTFGVIQEMRITEIPIRDENGNYITVDLVFPAQKKKDDQAGKAGSCTISDFYDQLFGEAVYAKADIKRAKGAFLDFLHYAFSDPDTARDGIRFEDLLEQFVNYYTAMKQLDMKQVDEIYQEEILPHMGKYFTYGLKSHFRRYCVAGSTVDTQFYPSVDGFIEFLEQRMRPTVSTSRKSGKVLREFSIMGMSRPGWTKEIKEILAKKKSSDSANINIRHIIRNFQLKRALEIYYDRTNVQGLVVLCRAFQIPLRQRWTSWRKRYTASST